MLPTKITLLKLCLESNPYLTVGEFYKQLIEFEDFEKKINNNETLKI